jgi:hypothetical protein
MLLILKAAMTFWRATGGGFATYGWRRKPKILWKV